LHPSGENCTGRTRPTILYTIYIFVYKKLLCVIGFGNSLVALGNQP
jgi:hypothetical protein